jgi:hypothetical protein
MRRKRGRPANPSTLDRYLQIAKFVYYCRGAMDPCREWEVIEKTIEAFGVSKKTIYKALKAIGRTPELEHEMADASLWLASSGHMKKGGPRYALGGELSYTSLRTPSAPLRWTTNLSGGDYRAPKPVSDTPELG